MLARHLQEILGEKEPGPFLHMRVVGLLVGPPIKVQPRLRVLEPSPVRLRDNKADRHQLRRLNVADPLRVDPNPVLAGQELEVSAIARKQEVMVQDDAFVANEKAASTGQTFLAVDPYAEILTSFTALDSDVHALDHLSSTGRAVEKRAKVDLGLGFGVWAAVGTKVDDRWLGHSQSSTTKEGEPRRQRRNAQRETGNQD